MGYISVLKTWYPFLLEGLLWNLIISLIATFVGIMIGSVFVVMKFSKFWLVRRVGDFVPGVFRGAPTLFLLFYLAIIIPNEVSFFGGEFKINISSWMKASIALMASPLAFASWNLHSSIKYWKSGQKSSALLFVPNCMNGFLITFLASSGASLVGVSELVGRTNTVIKAVGPESAILLYTNAVVIFLVSAWAISTIVNRLSSSISVRVLADA